MTRYRWLLLALVLFAGGVRLFRLDWDQYHFYHPDERAVASAVNNLSFRPLQLNPKFFNYGSLPFYATKAATSLLDNAHVGKTYPMTGPEALTRAAMLATIGATIGRELSYVEISAEAFAQQMAQYMPAGVIKMLLDYWSDTVAAPDVPLRTVEDVTGRRARTLATWAADHTQKAASGDQYAARHDGFTFFRSVTANQAFCAAHIVSFQPLPGDPARANMLEALMDQGLLDPQQARDLGQRVAEELWNADGGKILDQVSRQRG